MKRLFAIIQALAVCAGLSAQNANLNPTVQVTNAYENNMQEAERKPLEAEIPDSLYKFDLNFDYSGFEKPYKGNDEFNPFLTELDLVARPFDGRNFHLKAGAGYTLHPQLNLSWLFPSRGRFKAGLFAEHKSYFGKYAVDDNGIEDFTGIDSYSKAGFEGRADWDRIWLQSAVWYDGVYAKTDWSGNHRRNYNSGSAMLKIASRDCRDAYAFKFALSLEDSFGVNKFEEFLSNGKLRENVFKASLLLGYQAGHSFFGLDTEVNALSGSSDDNNGKYGAVAVALRPQYRFTNDVIMLQAGVSMLIGSGNENVLNSTKSDGSAEKFNVWPFVSFEWNAVPDKFRIFADADLNGRTAGERNAWENSHMSVGYAPSIIKTASADLGFKGTLWKKMQWKLGAGYENIRNANVFGLDVMPGGGPFPALGVIPKLEDFNFFLDVKAKFGIFSLDADLCYRAFLHKEDYDVLPSAFTADLRAKFDIRRRASVYAGVDFRSSRPAGNGYNTPHFVDLYAGADFRLTQKLGLFIEGRNLLNRQLQTVPMIYEKGFVVTGGIVLNF